MRKLRYVFILISLALPSTFRAQDLLLYDYGQQSVVQSDADDAPTTRSDYAPLAQADPASVRVSTRLIEVSIIARDQNGTPITGLKKEDFTVFDQGKHQEIAFFAEERNSPPEVAPTGTATNEGRTGAVVWSNRVEMKSGGAPSMTVILLDALNTQFTDMSYARAQVVQFLQQLQPQDRVAIYGLSTQLYVLHDFTSDSRALVAALNRSKNTESFQLSNSQTQESDTGLDELDLFLDNASQHVSDFYTMNRVDLTARALKAIANQLAGLPGRKNLVWVSGSFPFQIGLESQPTSSIPSPVGSTAYGDQPGLGGGKRQSSRSAAPAMQQTPPPPDNSFERKTFDKEVESATEALNNANLAIYPVDARGVMAPGGGSDAAISAAAPTGHGLNRSQATTHSETNMTVPPHDNIDTLKILAGRTGGIAFYGTNDISQAIRRAIEDSKVTYTLAYYPEHTEWDGTFHQIKVETKRHGVELRYREGYFAEAAPAANVAGDEQQLGAEIASPLENTTIGLSATVESAGASGNGVRQVRVHLKIEAAHLHFEQKDNGWADSLQLVWAQFASDGRMVDTTSQGIDMNLPQHSYEQIERSGLPLTGTVDIKEGAAVLRLVARDTGSGLLGSMNMPLKRLLTNVSAASAKP